MVFLSGPRQVGKTTLAQSLIPEFQDNHPAYLNWDFVEHQFRIKNRDFPKSSKIIVLDEVHKFKNWRNLIKGYYDTLKNTHSFLITGSARLDHYRKGGDSLLGRYHAYRLHPYSLPELGLSKENFLRLFEFGGFPEPLLEKDLAGLKRWHRQRLFHLIKMDLRDLENVKDVDQVQLLAEALPGKVGSPLSVKGLAEDLGVDFKTAKRWIGILDSLYYCFSIPPYGAPKIRAVKKEQKLYLWDWSQIEEPGIRFENMMACHLLKFCHFHEDTAGDEMELRYLRDTDKREVDFVVLKNKKPLFAVECKWSEKPLSPHIPYFSERTPIPHFYQVHTGKGSTASTDKITILSFLDFCKEVELR